MHIREGIKKKMRLTTKGVKIRRYLACITQGRELGRVDF